VIDLCENRLESTRTNQGIYLTSPAAQTASGRKSYTCEIKPKNNSLIARTFPFIRERMAQFWEDERLQYEATNNPFVYDGQTYNVEKLLKGHTIELGYNVNITLSSLKALIGLSRVFVEVKSSWLYPNLLFSVPLNILPHIIN